MLQNLTSFFECKNPQTIFFVFLLIDNNRLGYALGKTSMKQNYGKLGNVLLGHFIDHRTLISKECMCSNLKRLKVKDHEMQQKDRQISHSDCCSEIFLVWQRWLKEKV